MSLISLYGWTDLRPLSCDVTDLIGSRGVPANVYGRKLGELRAFAFANCPAKAIVEKRKRIGKEPLIGYVRRIITIEKIKELCSPPERENLSSLTTI